MLLLGDNMKICVFGAASMTLDERFMTPVETLGEELGKRGHTLVYGAGSSGEMGAVARGFKKAGSTIHGVVPEFFKGELKEFVNWDCDELTLTETMRERKFIMEDLADAFVIAPGGAGTFEEFFEVFTLKQLGQHNKPIAIFDVDGYYDHMQALIENGIKTDFIKPDCRKLYVISDDINVIVEYIESSDSSKAIDGVMK